MDRDIDVATRVRELELEVARLRRSDAVGDVAAALFEELRCLMAPISVGNELLAKKLSGDADLSTLAQHAATAASFASKLLRETIDFMHQPAPERLPLDCQQVLAGMQGLLTSLLGGSMALELDLSRTRLPPVRADRLGLERAVLNLVCHARESSVTGTVTLGASPTSLDAAEAHRVSCAPGRYVELEVIANLAKPSSPLRAGQPGACLRTAEWLVRERGWGFLSRTEAGRITSRVFLPEAT